MKYVLGVGSAREVEKRMLRCCEVVVLRNPHYNEKCLVFPTLLNVVRRLVLAYLTLPNQITFILRADNYDESIP